MKESNTAYEAIANLEFENQRLVEALNKASNVIEQGNVMLEVCRDALNIAFKGLEVDVDKQAEKVSDPSRVMGLAIQRLKNRAQLEFLYSLIESVEGDLVDGDPLSEKITSVFEYEAGVLIEQNAVLNEELQ